MSGSVYLSGSEDVASAGRQMSAAAGEIRRAAGEIEDSLFRFKQFMDDWLNRFESILMESRKETGS